MMKLSRRCEIAINVLVYCAQRPDEVVKIRDAAIFANASSDHTHQVACRLVQIGLLESSRGKKGGIQHAQRVGNLGIGQAIRLMQPALDATKPAHYSGALGSLLEEADHAAFATLDLFTIADLAGQGPANRLACMTCKTRTQFRLHPRMGADDLPAL